MLIIADTYHFYCKAFFIGGDVINNHYRHNESAIIYNLLFYRFLSVVKNQRGFIANQRWKWAIIWVWCLAFMETIPPLVGWSHLHLHPASMYCSSHRPRIGPNHISYSILYFLLGFFVPLTVQVFCYIKIYKRVSTVARKVRYRYATLNIP